MYEDQSEGCRWRESCQILQGWAGRTRQGGSRGGGGRQRWTPFRKQSLRHSPSAEKTKSTHATSRAGPGAAGLAGAHGGRGSEAGAEPPRTPGGATSPPGPPRRSRRPHARTSPTSCGRLPWRLAASPEAALNGCRSQSTTPRRGTSSPPAAPGFPAAPPLSREARRERAGAGEEEGRGCQRRRPLLRRIRRGGRHCASSPTSSLLGA